MLKLFKTVIRPNEGVEAYERDSKHRVTMGYDSVTKEIHVKMEEVIAPNPNLSEDLPEDTPTVLREPHEISDFIVVAERTFTEADFVKKTDNSKWFVEYDGSTKTISDPVDVYEVAKQYVNGSNSHEKIYYNLNEYRWQSDPTKVPLFVLDSFYKQLSGFSGSTVCFFVEDLQVNLLDSVLEGDAANAQEVTPKEYEYWIQYNVKPALGFEILDAEGKIIGSVLQSVDNSAKSGTSASISAVSPRDTTGISEGIVGPNLGAGASGNRFRVSLPQGELVYVRVLCGSRIWKLVGSNPTATFDIENVNGLSYKTRVSLPNYTPGQAEEPVPPTAEFIAQHSTHVISGQNSSFGGAENIVVRSTGLTAGDFIKVKFNVGQFVSYAELWIDIV